MHWGGEIWRGGILQNSAGNVVLGNSILIGAWKKPNYSRKRIFGSPSEDLSRALWPVAVVSDQIQATGHWGDWLCGTVMKHVDEGGSDRGTIVRADELGLNGTGTATFRECTSEICSSVHLNWRQAYTTDVKSRGQWGGSVHWEMLRLIPVCRHSGYGHVLCVDL